VIQRGPGKVIGILNGCDYSQWNPSTDQLIPANFDEKDLSGKALCKAALQKKSNLKEIKNVPLFGMVCRATQQKGFNYLLPIIGEFLQHKAQLVIMGTGDINITQRLRELANEHADKFTFVEAFSPEWAHLIEAGSDYFLMPSEFEPCGLNQMYSLAYATLPVVRRVGGLADTVVDVSQVESTGFVFEDPSTTALLNCLRKVLLLHKEQPRLIADMQRRAMNTRYTWERAALEYEQVYLS
jgi:starch synthase